MDYCSSCRRHLNGALVCPGCGAYAPDIDPGLDAGPTATAQSGEPVSIAPAREPWGTAPGREPVNTVPIDQPSGAAGVWEPSAAGSVADEAGAQDIAYEGGPAPSGRAARRRQRARWQKNRRRAAVATAVALVGGGLTVAAMDRGSGGRAQAATTPDEHTMNVAEEPAQTYAPPVAPEPRRPAGHSAPSHVTQPTTPVRQHTDSIATPAAVPTTPARPQSAVPVQPVIRTAPLGHTSAPQPSGAPVTDPGGTSTSAQQPSTPAGSGNDTAPAPAPSATSPSNTTPSQQQLCLLVVCLG
ncbi:hypothetical protein [Streptomyces sp. NPDC014006]|uniref:SCO2400 family protein n=1 Tax=Streptomyces sp. NPDC014006 TaxID=3364870 RepID=UPI0036F9F9D6